MRQTFLIMSLFFASFLFSQPEYEIKDSSSTVRIFPKKNNEQKILISVPKEIKIKNVSPTSSSWDKSMPWIAALVIGLLSAGVNFWVSHRLRQSNERNLQRQIDSSQKATLIQFKATIATKNRQDWINELRHELSELLAAVTRLTSEKISDEEHEKCLNKILYTKSKIQLMLNYEKIEQKNLIDEIENLFIAYLETDGEIENKKFAILRDNVIQSGRILLDIHWKKIKNLH